MGAQSSELKAKLWGASAAAIFGLSLSLAVAIGPAEADKVGVAAAVNPDAFSSLGGAAQSQLNIGKSIFFNERINTTGSGLVQVLLVDGSTFTVGPGSDLVIDKFVYDPKKQTGEVVASFSKGVMRFVGGKISKNEDGVLVKTPAGALAIRGGMFQAKINGSNGIFSFLYGKQMTLGGKYTVFEPGYTIDTTGGAPTIRPTTSADIKIIMAGLTNGSTSGLGNGGTEQEGDGSNPGTAGSGVLQNNNTSADPSQLINSFTQTQIVDTIQQQQPGTNPPPPEEVTVRILASPATYTAYGISIPDPFQHGILGGDDNPAVTVDDFIRTLRIENGRLVGTINGLKDGCSGDGCDPDGTKPNTEATLSLPWLFPANQCLEAGVCLVVDGKVTQGNDTVTYLGNAVHKPGFFAYNLAGFVGTDTPDPDDTELVDRVLLFGGDNYQFTKPAETVYRIDLQPDALQGATTPPFASSESMPLNGAAASITPLVLLEDGNRSVWLQTSFYLQRDETGALATGDQDSFINIALGGVAEGGLTEGGLVGMRRGGSHVEIEPCNGDECGPAQRQALAFIGDIATLSGPNGSHFMGTGQDPNIVIGLDSTGDAHNIGRDLPLNPIPDYNDAVENQSGATYHIGVGAGTLAVDGQTDRMLQGYAAGFAQQSGGGTPHILANVSANDVSITLNSATNSMMASLHLGDGFLQNPKYNLEFGNVGRSAFIDDNLFAAVEAAGGSNVSEQYIETRRGPFGIPIPQVKTSKDNSPTVQGYVVSADAISANEALYSGQEVPVDDLDPEGPQTQRRAFCQTCEFLKWGAWGARVGYKDHNNQGQTKDVHLGWWIAGEVVSSSLMPTTGKATYEGDAIGNVNNNGQQYVATGDMRMSWDFALRSGLLKIEDFDHRDFSGIMLAPGKVQFAGGLLGTDGLVGQANGAFVGAPLSPNPNPQGVIGNFGVGNSTWQATGIFGGGVVPVPVN